MVKKYGVSKLDPVEPDQSRTTRISIQTPEVSVVVEVTGPKGFIHKVLDDVYRNVEELSR
jgi:hypothetical protein